MEENILTNEKTVARREIRSFVKRENKIPSRIQKVWDEIANQYVLKSSSTDDVESVVHYLKQIFEAKKSNSNLKLIIEIGSGQGNQIVHAASECKKNTCFLGLEVFHSGLAHTLLLIRNFCKDNDIKSLPIRLAEIDAKQLFLELEKAGLVGFVDEIWTFFPDPWPKKKHHKRRLVNPDLKLLVKKILTDTGVWRLATDWEDYARQMEEVLDVAPTERFDGRMLTNFEKKGIEAGRRIYDFCFQNNQ